MRFKWPIRPASRPVAGSGTTGVQAKGQRGTGGEGYGNGKQPGQVSTPKMSPRPNGRREECWTRLGPSQSLVAKMANQGRRPYNSAQEMMTKSFRGPDPRRDSSK